MSAHKQRQLRDFIRRVHRLPCSILDGSKQTDAEILDLSESGVAVHVSAPWYALQRQISIQFRTKENELLTLKGEIVRQELDSSGGATIGIQFKDLDERAAQALIARSSSAPQGDGVTTGMGVFRSFATLLSVLSRFRERLQPSRRQAPRLPLAKQCRLEFEGSLVSGRIRDVSYSGVTAVFPALDDPPSQICILSIEDVELRVSPIESVERSGETLVRFRVESIEKGASEWHAWHQSFSH